MYGGWAKSGSPGMKPARYICVVDHGNKFVIWTALIVAISFSEVDVDVRFSFLAHGVFCDSTLGVGRLLMLKIVVCGFPK